MAKLSKRIIFIIGIIALISSGIFCFITFSDTNKTTIAERLLEVKTWVKEDTPSVIWTFTEPGKGTLTTNNHQNDYDFIWSVDGEKLKIETAWLYDLEDEYSIKLVGDNFSIFSYRTEEDSAFIPYPTPTIDPPLTENPDSTENQ